MYLENYPYNIFNPRYFEQAYIQQLENQRNMEQQKNIYDMVKAISDYCEVARKIHPDYQQRAIEACLQEIIRQMSIDNQSR